MKPLISVLVGILLLTGCSAQAKPELQLKYDEIELIRYRACFDYAINGYTRANWTYSEYVTDQAIKSCAKYLPVKK